MVQRHLNRFNVPTSWPIKVKERKWIARPMPGPTILRECITINLIIKELLNYAKTTREVKKILNDGKILINNIIRKDHHFPVGLMDTISVPQLSKYYRLLINKKGKFYLKEISSEDATKKICKIINKTILKSKKLQLNLFDGRSILIDKDEFKPSDSVLIDLTSNKIKDHIKFEKGVLIYLTKGSHKGEIGILQEIIKTLGSQEDRIKVKIESKIVETFKKYAFVVGKDKPLI